MQSKKTEPREKATAESSLGLDSSIRMHSLHPDRPGRGLQIANSNPERIIWRGHSRRCSRFPLPRRFLLHVHCSLLPTRPGAGKRTPARSICPSVIPQKKYKEKHHSKQATSIRMHSVSFRIKVLYRVQGGARRSTELLFISEYAFTDSSSSQTLNNDVIIRINSTPKKPSSRMGPME